MKPKKIAYINLAKNEYEVKNLTELEPYIGGVGIGIKLYQMHQAEDPIIFSIGPLNGFFPFASKTCVTLENDGTVEDLYLGGSLSSRIKYAGLDAIVFLNTSSQNTLVEFENDAVRFFNENIVAASLGLPGKKSVLEAAEGSLVLDGYFEPRIGILYSKFVKKNLNGFVITGTKAYEIEDFAKYRELFKKILSMTDRMKVPESTNPSCFACPMGCDLSKYGEVGGNVLVHSLVACYLAEDIYNDIGIVFACLDVLGYKYTHEDLENFPELISKTLKDL